MRLPVRLLAAGAVVLLSACGRHPLIAAPDAGSRTDAHELYDELVEWLDVAVVEVQGARCAARLGDGRLVEVVGVTQQDDPVLVTPHGRVAVDDWLLTRHPLDELLELLERAPVMQPVAVATAPDHHLARIQFHPLVGMVLLMPGSVVLTPQGRWSVEIDHAERDANALDSARQAIEKLTRWGTRLESDAWATFCEVLERATQLPDEVDPEVDDLLPPSVRRMVRHGWLTRVLPEDPRALAAAAAIRAACTPRPAERWRRGDVEVTRLVDAFGRESWTRRAPGGNALATPAPIAEFGELDWTFPDDGWIVLELPGQVDPGGTLELDDVRTATFFESATAIASWDPDAGLSVDPELWREEVPVDGLIEELDAVADYLPPHIVLVDARADLLGLATAHGVLAAPTAGESAERFLADAARVLPDPAHLDLVGEYFVDYAYDGPDIERPDLPGTFQIQGDRHQTVSETLASVRGGICTGDCDDLAELYVEVMRRQGRNALAVGVPGHMLAASAERTDAGWAVHVLQTGPAETHRAASLADAVESALRAQDPAIEPDVLLIEAWPRVDDGPLRVLTWIDAGALADADRIAHVVDCARLEARGLWGTSAEVRREDLERHEALREAEEIAAEDLEAAALHARLAEARAQIGDPDGAARHARSAAALTRRTAPRIGQRTSALLASLGSGVPAIVDADLAALRLAIGDLRQNATRVSALYLMADTVDQLIEGHDGGLAGARLAAELLPEQMRRAEGRLLGWRPDIFESDDEETVVDALDFVAHSAARALRLVDGPAQQDTLRAALMGWVELCRRRGEYGDWTHHAAVAGTLARDDPDAFVARLAQVQPGIEVPETTDDDPWPWIAGVLETWEWELRDRLAPGQPTPDAEMLRALVRGLDRAAFARQSAGLFDEFDLDMQIWARLVRGVLLDDDAAVGAAVSLAESQAPDTLAQVGIDLARLGPRVPTERYLRAVRRWLDTGGRERDGFAIVWATRRHASHHLALVTADLVCERFPADQAFAQERQRLAALER